jgi:hypothetical protein
MEYWQSQTDRAKNDAFKLQQELEYYKNTLDPIAKVIENNPKVLDNIESLDSGNPSTPAQAAGERNSLEPPVRPEKPHSYNEVDAYNDPESESFKFRLDHDKWRDDMLFHYAEVDKARENHQKALQVEQQKSMVVQNAYNYAVSSFNMSPDKATDFVRWAQNPNNITMDTLLKVYQMKDAPTQQQAQAQQKVVQMNEQNARLKVPRPTTVQTGQTPPPVSEEQSFSNALLDNGKRR